MRNLPQQQIQLSKTCPRSFWEDLFINLESTTRDTTKNNTTDSELPELVNISNTASDSKVDEANRYTLTFVPHTLEGLPGEFETLLTHTNPELFHKIYYRRPTDLVRYNYPNKVWMETTQLHVSDSVTSFRQDLYPCVEIAIPKLNINFEYDQHSSDITIVDNTVVAINRFANLTDSENQNSQKIYIQHLFDLPQAQPTTANMLSNQQSENHSTTMSSTASLALVGVVGLFAYRKLFNKAQPHHHQQQQQRQPAQELPQQANTR